MFRKEVIEVLNGILDEQRREWAKLDEYFQEKLDWLEQIRQEVRSNKLSLPLIPKTPLAAKRRKKCRLSTISEDQSGSPGDSVRIVGRCTRNATKRAQHETQIVEDTPPDQRHIKRKKNCTRRNDEVAKHIIQNLEDTLPDPRPNKRKENTKSTNNVLSTKTSVEEYDFRREAVVILTPLKLRKEITFVDDSTVHCLYTSRTPCISDLPHNESIPVANINVGSNDEKSVEDCSFSTCLNSTVVIEKPGISNTNNAGSTNSDEEINSKEFLSDYLPNSPVWNLNCTYEVFPVGVVGEEPHSKAEGKLVNAQVTETLEHSPGVDIGRESSDSVFMRDHEGESSEVALDPRVINQGSATPGRSSKAKKSLYISSSYDNSSVKEQVAACEKLKDDVPSIRMTRTKTRAIAEAASTSAPEPNGKPLDQNKCHKNKTEMLKKLARHSVCRAKAMLLKSSKKNMYADDVGKENSMTTLRAKGVMSTGCKKPPVTPCSTTRVLGELKNLSAISNQTYNSASSKPGTILATVDTFITKQRVKPTLDEIKESKLEELKRRVEKELEAARKRDEIIREKVETQKRKREEKMQKVLQTREAYDKVKQEQLRQMFEEKNERFKHIMEEQEAKHKEVAAKKQQCTKQKIAEEKEAALLREKEEQLARAEAKAKGNHTEKMKQTEKKMKAAKKAPASYDMTPCRDEMPPASSKTCTDYGIDDVHTDDSSDNEDHPKKIIPLWARKSARIPQLEIQELFPRELLTSFMSCHNHTPDLTKIFKDVKQQYLTRTSSAVWRTPPRYSDISF